MEDKKKFTFCTVVCDGCACRADSNITVESNSLMKDEGYLLSYLMEVKGWVEVDREHDKYLCKQCSESEKHRKYPGEGRIIREDDDLFYGVRCDLCGKLFVDEDDSGSSHYYEQGAAIDDARGGYGWNTIPFAGEDGKDYCPDCWHICKAFEDDLECDCEECPNWDRCLGEGDLPNKKPSASLECPCACPYLNSKKCSLPEEEAAKCLRLIAWANEKPKLIAQGRIKG